MPFIGLFAERSRAIADGIRAPFGSVEHPDIVNVYPDSIRARAWSALPASNSSCRAYIVVVNTNEAQSTHFSLQLSVLGDVPALSTAKRMFNAEGSAAINSSGHFSAFVDAGNTDVFCAA